MPRLSIRRFDLRPLKPEVLENVRRKDRASFFEEEGLKDFLYLKWDMEINYSQVVEFLDKYNTNCQMVSMSTGVISIDDKLLHEAFHLPLGNYTMQKRNTATEMVSPYFSVSDREGKCFKIEHCTDEIWRDRFVFLQKLFCCESWIDFPYNFMEFLQAKGKKRNWVDAFKWFVNSQIRRIREDPDRIPPLGTRIGIHVSLLLAHMQRKKTMHINLPLAPKKDVNYQEFPKSTDGQSSDIHIKSLGDGKNSSDWDEAHEQLGEDEENDAAKDEGETYQEELGKAQTVNPSSNTHSEEDYFLKHFDMGLKHFEIGREGIRKLMIRVAGLRDEVELWKTEYGNRSLSIAELGVVNDSLKTEVEKWKSAYGNRTICVEMLRSEIDSLKTEVEKWKGHFVKAEQAREELEEKVTTFWTTTKLGTTKSTRKQPSPVPEDNTSSKKTKMENTGCIWRTTTRRRTTS